MWRNPLEAGQKFNKANRVKARQMVSRNPLEAGQKFNIDFVKHRLNWKLSRNPLEAGQKFNSAIKN